MVITLLTLVLVLVLAATYFSKTQGLGIWLLLMITHGILYQYIGKGSENFPLLVGIGITIIILLRRQFKGVSPQLMGNVVLLFIIMAIAAIFGINHENSLGTFLLYAKGFFLVILLAGSLHEEKEIKTITLYCLSGLTVGGAYAVYQYITGTFTINSLYVQRAAGLRGDPNDTAMLLLVGVPIASYWFLNSVRVPAKLLSATSMALLLVGIVLTGSRGAFVALLLMMLIIFFRRPSFSMFVTGLLLATSFVVFAPQSYKDRMGTLLTGKEINFSESLENRKMLQTIGVSIFFNNPLFGVGPGNFSDAFIERLSIGGQQGAGGIKDNGKTHAVAHNMYLEFFAENGAVGGILLLSLFILSIHRSLRYDRLSGISNRQFGLGFSLAISLGGMLFAGLFLSQGKNSVLWFVVGMGFALGAMKPYRRREDCNGIALSDGHPAASTSINGPLPSPVVPHTNTQ